ncbi:MAG: putative Ig domain-containing protein [Candidatus Korobacteraceae bacterium]
MNSYDGRVKAVAAIVGAGTNNAVDIFATGRTDVILDITGYFVGPGNSDALYYYPLKNVCELVNTINPPTTDGLAGPALQNGVTRTFQVTNTPNCSIPSEAASYAVNITATPVNGASLGFLSVWPSDQAQPYTSNLNSYSGTAVANSAIVGAGGGSLSVLAAGADTHLQLDLVGYFAPKNSRGSLGLLSDGGQAAGDALYAFAPCRGNDTRPNTFMNRLDYVLQRQGGCQTTLPVLAVQPPIDAFVLNATVVPAGEPLGYFPIWPYGQQMPVPSALLSMDGAVTSNMAIVPTGRNGEISAFAGSPTNLIYDVTGYFASPKLTMLTQMPLAAATMHVPYGPVTMQARGGVPPYTWSATLPGSLTIDAGTGVISGCPTDNESGTMMVQVSDSGPSTPSTHFGNMTMNVLPTFGITMASLPNGTLNTPYRQQLTAAGGYGSYTWSLVSGQLPPGFSLNGSGVISGYDAGTRGTWRFTVAVSDQECAAGAPPTHTFSIRIN